MMKMSDQQAAVPDSHEFWGKQEPDKGQTSLLTDRNTFSKNMNMAAAESSSLTTHVLNIGDGLPAARLPLSLHRLDAEVMIWHMVTVGTTNEDGRCPGLISREEFKPGMYKIRFETGVYWESLGQTSFYPYIEVVFSITDTEQKFHLPLLMSRFSYSTYRGS
ncbi:5-hydroxyisourate hydrolase-like [Synchiropus splendidus]|uniref:5-hydroxyisourate hydrolase-like n=1 Tax=Synchiropus splendidus TaxID=270530 RepID=UPI00237D99AD|nr:5-hydroxyisourate hydrolase-like [Synchiropus splendidus]